MKQSDKFINHITYKRTPGNFVMKRRENVLANCEAIMSYRFVYKSKL